MAASARAWLEERYLVGRLNAAGLYRRARGWPFGLARLWRSRGRAAPVILVPQDLRTADPVRADEIVAGLHVFAGRTVSAANPFAVEPPSEEWLEALWGFGWLRHLRAAGTPEAAEAARGLILAWLDAQGRQDGPGWQPRITAERVRAWLSACGLMLAGADEVFYRRFTRSLSWQMRVLQAQYRTARPGIDRLTILIALVTAALCVEGEDKLLAWAARALGEELDRQILPDGGHVSRHPGVLVGLVLDLLPLRQLFPARNATPPAAILTAVDRMMPMIRFFQLGDGALARFNGMGPTPIDMVGTALVYDDTRGQVSASAPHSGFERLEAGDTVVIADAGKPPPPVFAGQAHAGTLSFEMSSHRQLVVINCGVSAFNRALWQKEARKTAAHSTVTVADRSSSRFAARGPAESGIIAGPRMVECRRGGLVLTMSHDGYRPRLGIVHSRVLSLADNGARLDGEDRIEGGDAPYALRFHLHPAVQAIPTERGHSVLLVLPAGEAWAFAADRPVTIEESVALAMPTGPRRTTQLVVEARSGEAPRVRWTFRRMERPQARADSEPAPELPF